MGQRTKRRPRRNLKRVIGTNGYALRWVGKDHHLADSKGYAYEHRIVAEQKLGRRLVVGEVVHHINHDRLDNRPYEWGSCGLAPGSIPSSAIDAHLAAGGSEPDDEQRWLRLADRHGGDWAEWPVDLRHRAMPRRELFRAV